MIYLFDEHGATHAETLKIGYRYKIYKLLRENVKGSQCKFDNPFFKLERKLFFISEEKYRLKKIRKNMKKLAEEL